MLSSKLFAAAQANRWAASFPGCGCPRRWFAKIAKFSLLRFFMQPGLRSGKLTKWKDERGFGFIQPVDGSQEVFLHISEVKDATRRPQEKTRFITTT